VTSADSSTAYDGDDFYCDVALADISALDVVEENEQVLAYHHTRPYRPVHIVVIPKQHVGSLTTLTAADEPLARELFVVVQRVAAQVEAEHGAAAVLTNLGDYQDSKHLHVHVLSGARV
jgi:histidine triad (HIT) family protein